MFSDTGTSFTAITDILRLSLAHVFLFVLLVLNLMALPLPVIGAVNPYWAMIAIFYWAVYRPTLVPPVLCFLAGLFVDLLSGGMVGMNAFIFVALQWTVRSQRRFLMGQPFLMAWLVFGVVAVAVGLVQWVLQCIAAATWLDIWPSAIAALLSFFLFPYIYLLLNGLHRLLPVARTSYS